MADPMVLYVVTAIVVAGLAIWVVVVLLTADNARPMAPMLAPAAPAATPPLESRAEKTGNKRRRAKKRKKERAEEPKAEEEEEEEPDDDDKEAEEPEAAGGDGKPADPVIADKLGSSSALVVALPTMRQRLDSHPEIEDGGAAEPESQPYQAPESVRPPGPALSLATAMGRTDPATRKQNEDAFAIIDRHHLFVVADGAGRAAPDVASQLAVDAIAATFDEEDPKVADVRGLSRRANRLRRAVLSANRKILERAIMTPANSGMGASAVAVHFSPDNHRVHVAHVGDARCYRVRAGAVALVTNKTATEAALRLGARESLDIGIVVESPEPGDLYVVCSDGLSRALTAAEILASVSGLESLEDATTKLVDRAKAKGDREDITAILVRVEAPA
jgi:serine/threonine protein phosphatase PrpC